LTLSFIVNRISKYIKICQIGQFQLVMEINQ